MAETIYETNIYDASTRIDFDNMSASSELSMLIELEEFKDQLRQQLLDQQDYINEYHNTFDTLYRASEQVRFQQKYQATEQAKIAAVVHKEEIEEIKKNQQKLSAGGNFIEFVPPDIEVNAAIEKYFLESLATGIPVFELIPPTIMQQALHMFSSSSEDTSSSDHNGDTTTSSDHDSHSHTSSSGSSVSSGAPHVIRRPKRGITVKIGGRVIKKASTNGSESIASVSSICDDDHIEGTVTTTTTTTTTYETAEGTYTHTTISNVQTTHEETSANVDTCTHTSNVTVIYDTPTDDPITYNEKSVVTEIETEVSANVSTTESTSNIQITHGTVVYTETKEVDVTETKVSNTAVTTEKTANVQISYDSSNIDTDYSYVSNVQTFKDGPIYEKEFEIQVNYEASNLTSEYIHTSNIEGSYAKTSNTSTQNKFVENEITQGGVITETVSNINVNTETNSNNEVTYIRTSNLYTEIDDVPISYSNTFVDCQSNLISGTPDCEYTVDHVSL